MVSIGRDRKRRKSGGRRRNYEPTVELTGIRRILPVGWGNWGGTLLFGWLGVAMFGEFIRALGRTNTNDWIAALITTGLLFWIAVLFANTRWKDYV